MAQLLNVLLWEVLAETPKCVCDPEYRFGHRFSSVIGEHFKICAYTWRDITGVVCGLLNILCWLFAQFPQLVKTYKNKTGGALSWPFLIIWLVGDICNLLGSLFTSQQILLYTAIYFVIMDALILAQIVYYEYFYKKKKTSQDGEEEEETDERAPLSPRTPRTYGTGATAASPRQSNASKGVVSPSQKFGTPNAVSPSANRGSSNLASPQNLVLLSIAIVGLASIDGGEAARSFASLSMQTLKNGVGAVVETVFNALQDPPKPPICDAPTSNSDAVRYLGTTCAWICGMLYFTARIPQAWKIYKEKNVFGVSFFLFLASFVANILYSFSILLPNTTDFSSTGFWRDTFPYLIGSLGANVFSLVIMIQFFMYPAIAPEEPESESPIPSSEDHAHATDPANVPVKSPSDFRDVKPSHDYSTCPPHHNHDDGTGEVGELVLEIAPSTATTTPLQTKPKPTTKGKKSKKTPKQQEQENDEDDGHITSLSQIPAQEIDTNSPGSSIQY